MGLINTETLRKAAAIIKRAVDNEQLVGNDDETRNILANVKTIMTKYQLPVEDDDFDLPDLSYNEDAETARLIAESNANRARAMGQPVASYDIDAAPTIQMSADDVAKAHSRKNNNYTTAVKRKGSAGRPASTSATTARRRRANTRSSTLTGASMRNRDSENKTGMYIAAVVMFFAIAITIYLMSSEDKKSKNPYKTQTKSDKWNPHAEGPPVKKSDSKTVGGTAVNPLANGTTSTTGNAAFQNPIITPKASMQTTTDAAAKPEVPEDNSAKVEPVAPEIVEPAAVPAPEPDVANSTPEPDVASSPPVVPDEPILVSKPQIPPIIAKEQVEVVKVANPDTNKDKVSTAAKPKQSEAYLRRDKTTEKNYFNDDGTVVDEGGQPEGGGGQEPVRQDPLPPELQ